MAEGKEKNMETSSCCGPDFDPSKMDFDKMSGMMKQFFSQEGSGTMGREQMMEKMQSMCCPGSEKTSE